MPQHAKLKKKVITYESSDGFGTIPVHDPLQKKKKGEEGGREKRKKEKKRGKGRRLYKLVLPQEK